MQVSSVSIIRTSALFPSLLQAERMSLGAHPASSHLCNQFVPRIYSALQKKMAPILGLWLCLLIALLFSRIWNCTVICM